MKEQTHQKRSVFSQAIREFGVFKFWAILISVAIIAAILGLITTTTINSKILN